MFPCCTQRKQKKVISDNYYRARSKIRISKYAGSSLLDLSEQYLRDVDMIWVAEEALVKKRCTQLDLSSNCITAQGTQIVAEAIPSSHLQMIDLGFNHITDDGVQSLVQALLASNSSKSTLTELRLSSNGITDEGIRYLTQLLEDPNNNVKHLWLSYNEITATGIQLLAAAITHNNAKLELLSLIENPFGDECADTLADMLQRNRSLKSLDISKTTLSLRSKARLKLITRTKPFFKLYLSGNFAVKFLMKVL